MPNQKSFSPREAEIVRRLAVGEPQKAIALHLGISVSAVETYIGRAKVKVGAGTVIQLVIISVRVSRVVFPLAKETPNRQNGAAHVLVLPTAQSAPHKMKNSQ